MSLRDVTKATLLNAWHRCLCGSDAFWPVHFSRLGPTPTSVMYYTCGSPVNAFGPLPTLVQAGNGWRGYRIAWL